MFRQWMVNENDIARVTKRMDWLTMQIDINLFKYICTIFDILTHAQMFLLEVCFEDDDVMISKRIVNAVPFWWKSIVDRFIP